MDFKKIIYRFSQFVSIILLFLTISKIEGPDWFYKWGSVFASIWLVMWWWREYRRTDLKFYFVIPMIGILLILHSLYFNIILDFF